MKNEKRKLPEGWAKSKLSELAEYINGKAFKPEEWEKEGTPIIRIENLTDKKAPFNYYRDECEEKYKIVDGNLLVSWSATLDAFIWQRGSAYLNQHIFKVVPSENKVNKFFLYFLLRYSMKKLRENIHGATMQHITKPKFDNFEVIHPKDIDDQIRIASELERKMAEIEKMRQAALSQKEAIAAMQGAILREVIPYKEGDKLPEGWRWTSLGNTELITIIMGQSPLGETYNKEKNGLPFFQGCADFGNIYPEPTVWCSKPKKVAEPNDLLLSVRAPVGPTNVAKEKCCIGRGLAALRCKEGLAYKYLKWILRKFEKQISSGGSGSIFNAIGKDEIKDIIFPLPPNLDDQIAIANELERKMAEIEKMWQAAGKQLESIETLPGAILREVFDFEKVGG